MHDYRPLDATNNPEQSSATDARKPVIQRKSATVFPYRGKWRVQYVDLFGRQRTKTADTKNDAYFLLAQIDQSQKQGRYELPKNKLPTVSQWLEFWISKKSHELKPSTLQGYRININKWLNPAVGHLRIDQLQPVHIQELYSYLLTEQRLSAGSVNRIHALLSGALKMAITYGVIHSTPMQFVTKPKEPRKQVEIFSREETQAILKTASEQGSRAYVRWILALRYGLRQGEALGLKFADIDRGVLRIARAVKPIVGKGIVEITPKSDSSVRSIPIDKQLQGLIAEIYTEPALFVFGGIRPVDATKDYRDWRKLLRAAGVRPLPLHAARHTCASELIARGVNPKAVQQLLGHASPAYTLATYVQSDLLSDSSAIFGSLN